MLVWDPTAALSTVAPVVADLADRLSECAGFQRLCDDKDPSLIREEHVKTGPQSDPWQDALDDRATADDLKRIRCRANVHQAEGNPHEAWEPTATSSCPDEGGTLEITIRWQVLDVELAQPGGMESLYLAFLDCIASIVHDLQELSNLSELPPRLRKVRMVGDVGFGEVNTESAQGVWMGATLEADWGDRGGGEN